MANRKNDAFRLLRIKKGDNLKTIYVKVKRSFTATDLQAFTEEDESVPAYPTCECRFAPWSFPRWQSFSASAKTGPLFSSAGVGCLVVPECMANPCTF